MQSASFITLLNVLVLFFAMGLVGRARGQYGVKAPATTGNELFERHYRVQMNTLEQLVAAKPASAVNLSTAAGSLSLLARQASADSMPRR